MRISFITFLLFVCVNLSAQQLGINDTENVLDKSEKTFIENATAFEMSFYNLLFPQDTFRLTDVNFTIFEKYSQFIAYQTQKNNTAVHHGSLGYYSFTDKEVVVCKEKQPKTQFLKTCTHELSHFLLMQRINAPVWLNEGLATYFGNMKFGTKNAKHVKNTYLLTRLKTMIEMKDIDLQDFLSWDYAKFGQMSFAYDSYGYAIAYGIVLLMINKDEELTINIIRELGKNQSSVMVFDTYYNGGFMQFEKDFLAYYSK